MSDVTPTNPHDRRFTINSDDATTASLRAKVNAMLQPPINPRAAAYWNEILADHVRNQHRKRVGAECHISRLKRNAPEQVVAMNEVAA
jgi:hypothetical protein